MIIQGDCLDKMREMADNSIDFIVCDPPYGLSFMGKDWDGRIPSMEIWAEALRIAKPGAMLAAFGGSRTHHHLMLAIEGAGWEIRDCIFYLYGSGFPKSHNFGKKLGRIWDGYGTALKPSVEPVILGMKPLDGTYAENAQKWGIAGINIDDSRVEAIDQDKLAKNWDRKTVTDMRNGNYGNGIASGIKLTTEAKTGRWPANLILDEESAEILDQQSGVQASRFFYCAKASTSERNRGLEGMELKDSNKIGHFNEPGNNGALKNSKPMANSHPTVKPLSLMKYILKLLAPPGDPICLDPFAGSGSTLVAAKELGIRCIGIELSEEYCEIANKRLNA